MSSVANSASRVPETVNPIAFRIACIVFPPPVWAVDFCAAVIVSGAASRSDEPAHAARVNRITGAVHWPSCLPKRPHHLFAPRLSQAGKEEREYQVTHAGRARLRGRRL